MPKFSNRREELRSLTSAAQVIPADQDSIFYFTIQAQPSPKVAPSRFHRKQRQKPIEAPAEVCYMLPFEKNGECFKKGGPADGRRIQGLDCMIKWAFGERDLVA